MVWQVSSLDGGTKLALTVVDVHQPEAELILEEVTLATAITLNVRQMPEVFQAAPRAL